MDEITLRDRIAIEAMGALIKVDGMRYCSKQEDKQRAEVSYRMADAMLVERKDKGRMEVYGKSI